MKYFVTTIASLLATIVAARGGEKAPPAATDDGNIMSRVLALEKTVEEQRVQLEDVHDVVLSLHSRRTKIEKCIETEDSRVTFKCKVVMRRSLVAKQEFTAKKDSFFEGGNVFINNGVDGPPVLNGKGNLIVGGKQTDAQRNPGSHNVIIGKLHTYSAYGGFVAGIGNEISGNYASVTGGSNHIASGEGSSISGGLANSATGRRSSVSGGSNGQANGDNSSVCGGADNEANGPSASVTGGSLNTATGYASSIVGGFKNRTPFTMSTVTGTKGAVTTSDWENLP